MEFPVLAVLGPEDRAQLLADLRRREFSRDEVLVHEGDPADSMHLIAKGRVLVTLMSPNAERVDVAILGAGKCFGELSMLSRPERRTATITAIEPTETLILRRDQLDRLRRRYPAIDPVAGSSCATSTACAAGLDGVVTAGQGLAPHGSTTLTGRTPR